MIENSFKYRNSIATSFFMPLVVFLLIIFSNKVVAQCPATMGASISPLEGCETLTIQFNDLSGPLVQVRTWDFGDGAATSSAQNPIHSFNAGQSDTTYIVTLAIDCIGGVQDTITDTVTVFARPKVNFIADTIVACALSDSVCFQNLSDTGVGYTYGWNFGDFTTSTLKEPCHTYTLDGIYDVSLVVVTDKGCQNTYDTLSYISIVKAPSPAFSLDTFIGCHPLSISFTNTTDTATTSIASWLWNFGDGSATSIIENPPSHLYTQPDTVLISLAATSTLGCFNSSQQVIVIKETPTSTFSVTTPVCVNEIAPITYTGSANSTATYIWNFDSGTPTTGATQGPHTPLWVSSGFKNITLDVTVNGCSTSSAGILEVTPIPIVYLTSSAVNDSICAGDNTVFTAVPVSYTQYEFFLNGVSVQSTGANTYQNATLVDGDKVTVSVLDGIGCTNFSNDTIKVNVKALPVVSVTSSLPNDTLCLNDAVTFTATPSGYDNYEFLDGFLTFQNGAATTAISTGLSNGSMVSVKATEKGCDYTSNIITNTVINPLQTPVVNCGTSTNSSVEFVWNTVSNSTGYIVSENGTAFTPPSSGSTGLLHSVTGLLPNDSITIKVIAKGNLPCGDGDTSLLVTCVAVPCNAVTFSTSFNASICETDSTILSVSSINTSNFSIIWNNIDTTKNINYSIFPMTVGDTVISVTVIDSTQLLCPPTTKYITLTVEPLANIVISTSVSTDTICQGEQISFTATPAGYGTYYFYNGFQLLQSGLNNVYTTNSWVNGDSITVSATNQGCSSSNNSSINVVVKSPLVTPQVNCGNTTNSTVQFDWDSIPNATGYEVSINGGLFVTASTGLQGVMHTETGLSPGTPSTIMVRALGNLPCGNSVVSLPVTCFAVPCSAVTFDKSTDLTLCAGETATVSVNNISTSSYALTYGGNTYTTATSVNFMPIADTIVTIVLLDSTQLACPSVTKQVNIVVNPIPSVTLSSSLSSDSLCTNASVIFTAAPMGYGNYGFFNSFQVLQSTSNHEYVSNSWMSGDSINVIATELGCTGAASATITFEVFDPLLTPQVNCGTSTNNTVEFLWDSIAGSVGYEISVNGATFVTPTTGIMGLSNTVTGLNPLDTATITVRALGNLPCGDSPISTILSCYAIPCTAITFDASNNLTICEGETANVSITNISTASYGIEWSGSSATSVTAITLIPIQDTVLTITLIDSTQLSCPSPTKQVAITVNPIPSVSLTSSVVNDSICAGSPIVFTANPALYDNYTFIKGYQTLQTTGQNDYTTTNWGDGDSIYVVVTDLGCVSSNSNLITTTVQQPLATPQINCGITTNTSIEFIWNSIPNSQEYQVSTDGGNTFVTPSSGINGLMHSITGLTVGDSITLYMEATGSLPCGNSLISSKTCYATPCNAVMFDLTTDTSICMGESIVITASNISATNYNITWNSLPPTLTSWQTITPTTDTIITAVLNDLTQVGCPSVTKQATILVNPIPTVTLSSSVINDSICSNATVTFTASPQGYDNYDFYNGYQVLQGTPNHQYVTSSWVSGDSINVVATALGCSSSASASISYEVFAPLLTPQVNCGTSTNNTVEFLWDSIAGSTGYEVSINGGTFTSPTASLSNSVTGLNTLDSVTIAVRAFGDLPCGDSPVSSTLTCYAIPCTAITFDASNNLTICEGETASVSITNVSSLNYGVEWSGNSAITATTINVVPTQDTTITITVIDSLQLSCPVPTKQVFITVNPIPLVILVSDLTNDSICHETGVAYTAQPFLYDNYTFYDGFQTIQNGSNPNLTIAYVHSYTTISVVATNLGCISTPSNSITVTEVDSLTTPQINCGTTTANSTEFVWDAVPNSIGYQVSIDGGNTFTNASSGINGLVHDISGLAPGDSVTLEIMALGNVPCGNSLTAIKTCYAIPCSAVTFDLIPNTIGICLGDSVTVTASNIGTTNYNITFGNASPSTNTSLTITPQAYTTITATLNDLDQPGCPSVIKNTFIIVHTVPSVTLASSIANDSLCSNGSITFTASPGGYTSYEFMSGLSSLQSTNGLDYTSSNWVDGDSIYVIATEYGCSSLPSNTIYTNVFSPLPAPQVNCGITTNNTIQFVWDSVINTNGYQVSVNGASYTLPSSGNLGLSQDITGLAFGDSATIAVFATGDLPCGDGNTSAFTTCYAIPCNAITFDKTVDQTLCVGEAVNAAISNISTSNYSIVWNGTTATTSTTNSFIPLSDTTLTITLIDSTQLACPAVTKQIIVTVNPVPTISIVVNVDTICNGENLVFTATPAGYDNYNFTQGFLSLQSNGSNVYNTSSWLTGDSLSVVATMLGCRSTQKSTTTIKVYDSLLVPQVNCGTTTMGEVEFVWDNNGATAYEISIDGGVFTTPILGSTALTETITGLVPSTSVIAVVKAIHNSPCGISITSNSVTCSAIPCSAVSFSTITDTTVCAGESLTVSLANLSTFYYGVTFGTNLPTTDVNYTFIPVLDTIITVSLLDSNQLNCPATVKQIHVNVNTVPVVSLVSSVTNDTICANQSIVFNAVSTGFDNYNFYNGFQLLQSSSNPTYQVLSLQNGDSISVVSSNLGCVGNVSNTIGYTVNSPLETPQVNCGTATNTSVQFVWNSINNTTGYQVSVNGSSYTVPSSGSTGLLHDITTGLNPGDTVTLSMYAAGDQPCGNSLIAAATCYSIPCTAITFDESANDTICVGTSVTTSITNLSTSNYSVIWSGGVATTATTNTFTPQQDTILSIVLIDSTQLVCPVTTKQIHIKVNPIPVATLTSSLTNDSICAGGELTITVSPGGFENYTFTDGTTTLQTSNNPEIVFTALINNTIFVSVTDNGCTYTGATPVSVEVLPLPTVTIVSDAINDTICKEDTITFTANPLGLINYQFYDLSLIWQDSSFNKLTTNTLLSSDYIYVVGTNQYGCVDTSTIVNIKVLNLPTLSLITSDADSTICLGDSVSFTAQGTNITSYVFNNDTVEIQNSVDSIYSTLVLQQGNSIYAFGLNGSGCKSDTSNRISINVKPIPYPVITKDTVVICIGDNITLDVADTSGALTSFIWSTGDTSTQITVQPSVTTTYGVVATLAGCTKSDSITVDIESIFPVVDAGADTIICQKEPLELAATGALKYVWNENETVSNTLISNPIITPVDTAAITYFVTGYNLACYAVDSIKISIDRCLFTLQGLIPQVISPNGDGSNDFWIIPDIDYFENNNVVIFNRWGNEVYSKDYYLNEWNGKSADGKGLPDGTYYYVLDLGNGAEIYTGFVMIHR